MLLLRSQIYCADRDVIRIVVNRLVMIFRKPLLVIGEGRETLLQHPKFMRFFGADRCFRPIGVFSRFGTILLGREHKPAFRRDLPRSINFREALGTWL